MATPIENIKVDRRNTSPFRKRTGCRLKGRAYLGREALDGSPLRKGVPMRLSSKPLAYV
jgi:hypothetical protein